MAINAQVDMQRTTGIETELTELAAMHGGSALIAADSVELRLPTAVWSRVFEEMRGHPAARGGEQVWGQDITEQVARLRAAREDADGADRAELEARLAFRLDRIERAVIVVRLLDP